MTKLLATSALMLVLAFTGGAFAYEDMQAKEGPPLFMQEALSRLPARDAELFHQAMQKAHEKDAALHEQIHVLHDQLHDIMAAKQFNKKTFLAQSAELEKLHTKMHANMMEAFASTLSKLPVDERIMLADALHERHEHHEQQEDDDSSPATK